MSQYDAIIVGAGMSGLTAGIRLAMFDQKVCIVERHNICGGLNSFYKQGGRLFDVGLHAMTNFAKKGSRKGPLPTVCRQLRIGIEQFELAEQHYSRVCFPEQQLRFDNNVETLTAEIGERFPSQVDGFRRLCAAVAAYDDATVTHGRPAARAFVGAFIDSPLLIDMLMCPLLFYGSATPDDMELTQFVIMFKAIFFEGFSRPQQGVRRILRLLRKRYLSLGGELRMKRGVARLEPQAGHGVRVHLENGVVLTADRVLSSAGASETLNMLGRNRDAAEGVGQMTFVETIFCLDRMPATLGIDTSIVFFSRRDQLAYRPSEELVDLQSGILCAPNNFAHGPLAEGVLRVTNIASFEKWSAVRQGGDQAYREAKQRTIDAQLAALTDVVPQFSQHIAYIDSFTPLTIKRYTGHLQGAVYGNSVKRLDGDIGERDVFLCGTDQGYLGIVGAMLSGILMANKHVLQRPARSPQKNQETERSCHFHPNT